MPTTIRLSIDLANLKPEIHENVENLAKERGIDYFEAFRELFRKYLQDNGFDDIEVSEFRMLTEEEESEFVPIPFPE